MSKVVIDTNVFVKAIFHGDRYAQEVLKLVRDGRLTMLMTDSIEEEILLTIAGHAIEAGLSRKETMAALRKALRLIQSSERICALPSFTACQDPDDNKFFDCAVSGLAEYIVTTDSHLQEVANSPVPVVSPWQLAATRQSNSRTCRGRKSGCRG